MHPIPVRIVVTLVHRLAGRTARWACAARPELSNSCSHCAERRPLPLHCSCSQPLRGRARCGPGSHPASHRRTAVTQFLGRGPVAPTGTIVARGPLRSNTLSGPSAPTRTRCPPPPGPSPGARGRRRLTVGGRGEDRTPRWPPAAPPRSEAGLLAGARGPAVPPRLSLALSRPNVARRQIPRDKTCLATAPPRRGSRRRA